MIYPDNCLQCGYPLAGNACADCGWSVGDPVKKKLSPNPVAGCEVVVNHKPNHCIADIIVKGKLGDEVGRVMAGEKIEPRPLVCHSFVRNGRIEFLGDCTHGLAGKTVDLPKWRLV